ncbi:hypothetical protein [Thermovirga lienii]|uniref:hypothetical protein n=1 Tax=Thermovirga lienii TaxID=336261 RepID=UPI002FDF917F
MIRRVALGLFTLFVFSSPVLAASGTAQLTNMNVVFDNVQEAVAVNYLKGFLGGDINRLYQYEMFPVPTDSILSLVWTRLVTHPYTRWRWENGEITNVVVDGSKVKVEGRLPSIPEPKTYSKLPKVVWEWKMYALTDKSTKKGISYKKEVRELLVTPTGKLDITQGQMDRIYKKCVSDALTALKWVQKNKKYSVDILPMLVSVWEQNEASTTVKLLPEVAKEWKGVINK